MLSKDLKRHYLPRICNPNLNYLTRKVLRKQILEQAKRTSICPNCGEENGTINKAGVLEIVHKICKDKKSNAEVMQKNLAEYKDAFEKNKEVESIVMDKERDKLIHFLNPIEVTWIFILDITTFKIFE